MTRVGVIETGHPQPTVRDEHGDFFQMFSRYFAGIPTLGFARFPIAFGEPVPDPSVCDAWIITGSPAGVYEGHAWIPPAKTFVQRALETRARVLGVCFGHQLMAEAMGGKVVKSTKGRGIGVNHYELTAAGKEAFLGFSALNLAAVHQDQVVEPAPNAVLLAQSAFCPYAAFAYGDNGLSFQPHPEFTIACARDDASEWQKRMPVPDAVFQQALRTLDGIPSDAQHLAPILGDFLTRGKGH